MSALTAAQARRRFLLLLGAALAAGRPDDPGDRAAAARPRPHPGRSTARPPPLQGITVLLLELPTGGLSDAIGRRPVLLLAGVIDDRVAGAAHGRRLGAAVLVFYVLQGVYRALDSGPLEAWYVDHALAADEHADIETGLSRSGVVLGVAIAGGALAQPADWSRSARSARSRR